MKIKAIIFDSSVLINIPKEEMRQALNKIISYYTPATAFLKKYKQLFKKLQTGMSEDEFFKKLLKDLPARSAKRIREQHDNKRSKLVSLNKGVKSSLTTLSNNYKIGLISNMPQEWFMKDAIRLGLKLDFFNKMLFADNKRKKPEDKVFIQACKELKVNRSRCAYITNHEDEALSAANLGMTVITLGSVEGDFNINELTELIDLFSNEDIVPKKLHEVDSP